MNGWLLVALVTTSIVSGSASSPASGPAKAAVAPTTAPAAAIPLTVVKGEQKKSFTLDQVKALPAVTGQGGQLAITGHQYGPYHYRGVALSELLKAVGGSSDGDTIKVIARDGYSMTLTHRQLVNGEFRLVDMNSSKDVAPKTQPIVFLAYEEEGKPNAENMGPLRLGILSPDGTLSERHWWVKQVQTIEVVRSAR